MSTTIKLLLLCGLHALRSPSALFTLQGVTLGETSELDLLAFFGEAARYGSGGARCETFVCYFNEEQGVLAEFSLGFPIEGHKVMGFEVSSGASSALCKITTRDLRGLPSASGVLLGMKSSAFTAALNLPFRRRGDNELWFERLQRRGEADEGAGFTVTATFKDDSLTRYAVRLFDLGSPS